MVGFESAFVTSDVRVVTPRGTELSSVVSVHSHLVCGPTDLGYESDAWIPVRNSRPLTSQELAALASGREPAGPRVELVEIPARVVVPIRAAIRSLCRDGERDIEETLLDAYPALIADVYHVLRGLNQSDADWVQAGIAVMQHGWPSTTVDPATGRRVGLHVDSWYGDGLECRASAPNRICVNLGAHPRSILFAPWALDSLARSIAWSRETSGADIIRSFCEMRRLPVVALRIEPGFAYIAPTEYVAHDGRASPNAIDVTMTARGRF